jgi:hypothetical protein
MFKILTVPFLTILKMVLLYVSRETPTKRAGFNTSEEPVKTGSVHPNQILKNTVRMQLSACIRNLLRERRKDSNLYPCMHADLYPINYISRIQIHF